MLFPGNLDVCFINGLFPQWHNIAGKTFQRPEMKPSFEFYFRMLICTGVICALVYGIGEHAVEQSTSLSLAMLAAVMTGIGGMIKHLSPAHPDNAGNGERKLTN